MIRMALWFLGALLLGGIVHLATVLLLPSLEEGSALVCGEAMGAGCALLVSDDQAGVIYRIGYGR